MKTIITTLRNRCAGEITRLFLVLVAVCLTAAVPVRAEEETPSETEETEYIPEAYYDPIQSNETAGWPQGPAVPAGSAIVMDLDTRTVLYAKSIREKRYPASITKVMTALIALEHTDNLDRKFICSEEVFNIEAGSSNVGIFPEEELTMRQALEGLMLESANDLAMAIAIEVAGSVSAFADMMNEKAAELGCTNTHFVNPHGLHDDNHYTCAYDMALISRAAYEDPQFRKLVSMTESSIPPTNKQEETRYFSNHHRMLQDWSDYYQEWCTGGKTGYTSKAGNTLVTFGEKNDLKLVCVVLREEGLDYSYRDSITLLEYGFDHFIHQTLTQEIDAPTFAEIMDLKYPDPDGIIYVPEQLMQKVYKLGKAGRVTIPKDSDWSMISISSYLRESEGSEAAAGDFRYLYGDWYIGYGSVSFTDFPSEFKSPFEQKRNMEPIIEYAKEYKRVKEIDDTAAEAWQHIFNLFAGLKEKMQEYIQNNYMAVVLSGAFIMLILIILILIIIRRFSRDSKMHRMRMSEDRLRKKREEEIDAKTAGEIEEELREAMRQEEERRLKEERRMEERIAEEAKLREAEQVLEEISRQEQQNGQN